MIVATTLVGVSLNFLGIPPMDALYWTAVVNGILAPPVLVLVMLAARDRKVMGDKRIGPLLTTLGWVATAGMFIALGGLFYTSLRT